MVKLIEALSRIENAHAQTRERDELAQRLTRVLAQMEAAQSTTVQTMNALEGELDRIRTPKSAYRGCIGFRAARGKTCDRRNPQGSRG